MSHRPHTPSPGEFWLLVAEENGRVLSVGEGALAVFSGEGEAELFRWCGICRTGRAEWRVRKTSPGELISLLYRRCPRTTSVALDPSPEMLSGNLVDLVSVGKSRFVERMVARRTPGLQPVS